MIRDITIGQYYPAGSILHKLDPRVKLMAVFCYTVTLFLFRNAAGFAVVTFGLAAMACLSKVPFGYMAKGLKSIAVILILTVMFQLFLTPGKTVAGWWIFWVTEEGLRQAAFMAVRLTYLVLGSSLLTLTTTPNHLTDGMEKAFRPLQKIGVPVHEVSMIMSIALRFIPILIEETDRIMKAQLARGAEFESGNLMKKVKSLLPLLVPLFVSAFRRAGDLALAMEARCYHGGAGRTKMKPLHYQREDLVAYLGIAGYFVAVLFSRRI